MKATPSKKEKWIVHKFGGTSVGNAERYAKVAQILEGEAKKNPGSRMAIVVSAMKGVTDGLIDMVKLASQKNVAYQTSLQKLKEQHQVAIRTLGLPQLESVIEKDFSHLNEILRGISLVGSAAEGIVEFVSGHGEIWSALILAAHLAQKKTNSRYLDAREVLVVSPSGASVSVLWETSEQKLSKYK